MPFFKVLINHSHNHQQNSLTVYIKTNHAWNINPPPPPQMFNNQWIICTWKYIQVHISVIELKAPCCLFYLHSNCCRCTNWNCKIPTVIQKNKPHRDSFQNIGNNNVIRYSLLMCVIGILFSISSLNLPRHCQLYKINIYIN